MFIYVLIKVGMGLLLKMIDAKIHMCIALEYSAITSMCKHSLAIIPQICQHIRIDKIFILDSVYHITNVLLYWVVEFVEYSYFIKINTPS